MTFNVLTFLYFIQLISGTVPKQNDSHDYEPLTHVPSYYNDTVIPFREYRSAPDVNSSRTTIILMQKNNETHQSTKNGASYLNHTNSLQNTYSKHIEETENWKIKFGSQLRKIYDKCNKVTRLMSVHVPSGLKQINDCLHKELDNLKPTVNENVDETSLESNEQINSNDKNPLQEFDNNTSDAQENWSKLLKTKSILENSSYKLTDDNKEDTLPQKLFRVIEDDVNCNDGSSKSDTGKRNYPCLFAPKDWYWWQHILD